MSSVTQAAYLAASVLFILALHWMNTPATARKGVWAGVVTRPSSECENSCRFLWKFHLPLLHSRALKGSRDVPGETVQSRNLTEPSS